MESWGMESCGFELEPGKSRYYPLRNLDNEHRILHITASRCTLCEGGGKEKSVIQYSVGDNKTPVDLCSLLPNQNESFTLSRELGSDDNSVEFSVVAGDSCIYLNAYLEIDDPNQGKSIEIRHESDRSVIPGLPSLEEIRRLLSTLPFEEFEETLKSYLTDKN